MDLALAHAEKVHFSGINFANIDSGAALDLMTLFDNLRICIEKLFDLRQELTYEPVKTSRYTSRYNHSLLVFGEMGAGKSTTLNHIILNLMRKDDSYLSKLYSRCLKTFNSAFGPIFLDDDDLVEDLFVAKTSDKSVTAKPELKDLDGFLLIDTPGFNDPKKKNLVILANATEHLNIQRIHKDGLSAILNVISFPAGGRIPLSAIQTIVKMLNTFTLSYPSYDLDLIK